MSRRRAYNVNQCPKGIRRKHLWARAFKLKVCFEDTPLIWLQTWHASSLYIVVSTACVIQWNGLSGCLISVLKQGYLHLLNSRNFGNTSKFPRFTSCRLEETYFHRKCLLQFFLQFVWVSAQELTGVSLSQISSKPPLFANKVFKLHPLKINKLHCGSRDGTGGEFHGYESAIKCGNSTSSRTQRQRCRGIRAQMHCQTCPYDKFSCTTFINIIILTI